MSKKGQKAPQHSHGEKIELARAVCALYESQGCTLQSACESVGMSDRLFRYWVSTVSEVSDLYKKAKTKSIEIYWDRLRDKAQDGLERLVDGTTYTETKNENGIGASGPISKTTETEVTVFPNVTAVIFALKGEYPDRFADRGKTDLTSGGKEILQSPLLSLPLDKQEEILLILQAGNDK